MVLAASATERPFFLPPDDLSRPAAALAIAALATIPMGFSADLDLSTPFGDDFRAAESRTVNAPAPTADCFTAAGFPIGAVAACVLVGLPGRRFAWLGAFASVDRTEECFILDF